MHRASSIAGESKCLPATSWIFNVVYHEVDGAKALSFEQFLLDSFVDALLEQFEGLLDGKGFKEIYLSPLACWTLPERMCIMLALVSLMALKPLQLLPHSRHLLFKSGDLSPELFN